MIKNETDFIVAMAEYFDQATLHKEGTKVQWIDYATDVYEAFLDSESNFWKRPIEFGDSEYSWDKEAAYEIAREDISYWGD